MSLGEFDLIDAFFRRPAGTGPQRAELGNGDDCALLGLAAGMQLAVSTDTLVEGRHFLSTVLPERLGHKALAVNLSDLAACGATPKAFTLALTLPRADEAWLRGFAQGLFALADAHGCELVGGDTTAGPLSIGITVMGEVPRGQALLRRGAQTGDDLWVSGEPGWARLALEQFRGTLRPGLDAASFELARRAMECPVPRVALGEALRGLATSAIDVSDGLLGDLGHVLRQSDVAASVFLEALPVGGPLRDRAPGQWQACVLAGGDDYELVFTAPPAQRERVLALRQTLGLALTRIGRIDPPNASGPPGARHAVRFWQGDAAAGPQALREVASPLAGGSVSFDHFKPS